MNKIWFMWLQGKESMPEVVRLCYESWHKHNQDWDIIFLDSQELDRYLDLSQILPSTRENITMQVLADVARINLLNTYGGVWVDATCYCNKPLNTWYPEQLVTGFFAFSRPAEDRMISNWFLGSTLDSELTKIFCDQVNHFWLTNPAMKPLTWFTRTSLRVTNLQHLLLKKPYLWHSFFFTKVLKQYPYLWSHYLFEKLYRENAVFKNLWDQTPKFTADIPHRLQTFGLFEPISDELKDEIDNQYAPVYKLSWKRDFNRNTSDSVYSYLKNVHTQSD